MKQLCNYWHKNFWGIGVTLVCCLLLLSLLRIGSADAQQSTPSADINTEQKLDCIEQELDNRINAFFTALMEGNTESAFREILRQSPLLAGRARIAIAGAPSQFEMLQEEELGNLCGWEKIESKRIGESVIAFQYVGKHERYAQHWLFVFYRTPSTTSNMSDSDIWVITQMHSDTEL